MGRFCFCALASFCFVRKDLWDYRNTSVAVTDKLVETLDVEFTYRHLGDAGGRFRGAVWVLCWMIEISSKVLCGRLLAQRGYRSRDLSKER